jgi:hypothetical protein
MRAVLISLGALAMAVSVAPMSPISYEDARPWARPIKTKTTVAGRLTGAIYQR